MSTEPEIPTTTEETKTSNKLRVIGWCAVGLALATAGFLVGRELRSRHKFKKRTPYDFYSNAGDKQNNEFGVGI